ncbi:unnamed protein product [Leptosia nina]|uniref:Ankyrin repeat, SAM and basic leucine zipper domain-containing protein 1 n=1 Tax=Leptosia nina TaxID=320188 RepID=A0AAV1JSV3_9NEOP
MFRPAGLSDEDSDSDEYGFDEKPRRTFNYYNNQENLKKKLENRLQDAIINGNIKEVEKIIALDLKNNVNIKLDSGWTALMHACFHAQKKIVDLILEKGADPNLHADSVTPVMVACSNSSASEDIVHNIVTSLISHHSLLNVGDKYGQTPLMRAVSSGRVTVVELLLSNNVNIEMRDRQGWTALFWAVHHNQAKILEILISKGARLTEIDMSSRTVVEIAQSHEYPQILEILNQHLKFDTEEEVVGDDMTELVSWQDYYPGIRSDERPKYTTEIKHLLYGMNCEKLTDIIVKNHLDLRTFLLLEEDGMVKLGIEMPFERQRLRHGLKAFHMKSWKLNTVAGLHVQKRDTCSVQECLGVLGSHLQQLYILEATLQYVLRDYCRIHNQIKFEPPDSPVTQKMQAAAKKVLTNIGSIRREIKTMKAIHTKISKSNPKPADLIKEKSTKDLITGYITDAIVLCSIGVVAYHTKNCVMSLLKK